jgi:hypothetical protein
VGRVDAAQNGASRDGSCLARQEPVTPSRACGRPSLRLSEGHVDHSNKLSHETAHGKLLIADFDAED